MGICTAVLVIGVCVCVCMCVQCSLQRPEYHSYRERFGCARSIDSFEEISAELKTLLMVGDQIHTHTHTHTHTHIVCGWCSK